MMQVQVVENVLKLNDEVAAMNRQALHGAGIVSVDLVGAPGCGKTALLEATLQRLAGQVRMAVIVGDMATQRDADRMARHCQQVVQINTGKGCHLEAHHIRQAIARLDLSKIDLLFIENVGNLICPVGFDLGQDARIGIFSVSGGDDKAAKHPFIIVESTVLLLTKTDLLPHIPFDMELFRSDIRQLNPGVPVLSLSAISGEGMEAWLQWLGSLRR
jgi:hydrogenase nickel incorporation protein HypB